jgi:hypothetical protein
MANYIGVNAVSRNLSVENRSWESVVHQAGLPVLDSELNLAQNVKSNPNRHRQPSGILSQYGNRSSGFVFNNIPNTLTIESFLANVAGKEIYVSGANSADPLLNHIDLYAPDQTTGLPPDIKRTDFVFLEVWRALVTPSTLRRVTISVDGAVNGAVISIDETALGGGVVTLTEGVDFNNGVDTSETARNIADAFNASAFTNISANAFTRGYNAVFIEIDNDTPNVSSVPITFNVNTLSLREDVASSAGDNVASPTKVYYEGNTQSHPDLWLDDDIIDPDLGYGTSRRVQIQYRFRTTSSSNPKVHYYGFDDLSLYAQGSQHSAVNGYYFSRANGIDVVRGNGTNSYPHIDSGLFYAGDGSAQSASDLGTVDGYVYAIPICYVFRRNEGSFDPLNTANSAPLSTHLGYVNSVLTQGENINVGAGESDHPDGLFSDIIVPTDVLDLRRRVYPFGIDFYSELKYQYSLLLDNRLRTWQIDGSDILTIGNGSGEQSTTPLVCDEIGRQLSAGRGNRIRGFDHVCRRFSSSPTIQRLPIIIRNNIGTNDASYPPYGGAVTYRVFGVGGGGGIEVSLFPFEDLEIAVDLSDLLISTDRTWEVDSSGIGVSVADALSDIGAKVIAVDNAYINPSEYMQNPFYRALTPHLDVDLSIQFSKIEGLGTDRIVLTLDRNLTELVAGGADPIVLSGHHSMTEHDTLRSDIHFDLIVEYPPSIGLSRTVSELATPFDSVYEDGQAVIIEDSNQSPYFVENTSVKADFNVGQREVSLEYVAGDSSGLNDPTQRQGALYHYAYLSDDLESVTVHDKVYSEGAGSDYEPVIRITGTIVTLSVDYTRTVFGQENTKIYFNPPLASKDSLTVEYYSLQAIPDHGGVGFKTNIYYRATAPQTCGSKSGGTASPLSLPLEVLSVGDQVSVIQTGVSSSSSGYPYSTAYEQLGVHPSVLSFTGEQDLLSSLNVSIEGFTVNTGFLQLPVYVGLDVSQTLSLGDPNGGAVSQDVEGRTIYTDLKAGNASYAVSVLSQPLVNYSNHKNAYPILAKVNEDTDLFRKGEVVLVVLTRYAELELDNKVILSSLSSDTNTVACVYRVENLMLLGE